MKRIGIVVKADAKVEEKADKFTNWLLSKGIDIVRGKTSPPQQFSMQRKSSAPADLSCIFVLGGDGTFLNAARWIGDQDIPILGVKFGEVGLLAEITEENLFVAAESILNKNFTTTPRMRLFVKVFREEKEIACQTVLNDIVINRGALARLAHIKTYIDDSYLTTYSADGLIVATPTGSTAYSLAAGGPIIHPAVKGIIMTSICPFTLTIRPLIIPESVSIKIMLEAKSSDVMLTFDGQTGLEINERDTIVVKKGLYPINMITMEDSSYFDVLKTKLRWSGGRG